MKKLTNNPPLVKKILLSACFILALSACKKEAPIVPTDLPALRYALPQGNEPYDAVFLDLYRRTNTYFLYKFDPVDAYYQPVNGSLSASTSAVNYVVAPPADPAYIAKVFAFVQNNWLNFYNDGFLKNSLPLKVLFCQSIKDNIFSSTNVRLNIESMAIANFGPNFDALNPAQKKTFKDDIHRLFWAYAIDYNRLIQSTEFLAASDYSKSVSGTAGYPDGFLNGNNPGSESRRVTDLKAYINAITSLTKAEFDTRYNTTVNTKIAQKYQILVAHYKKHYDIDLAMVGNTAVIN